MILSITLYFVARKQLKRKSDSLESKQKSLVKKLKGEDGTSSMSSKDSSEDDVKSENEKVESLKDEIKKENSDDSEEPMEVDCIDECDSSNKVLNKPTATSSRPKATAIHSFFSKHHYVHITTLLVLTVLYSIKQGMQYIAIFY